MVRTQKIRELHLTHGSSESHQPFISAASGLVVNDLLYVVADDEHHLGVFSADHVAPGELVRLFDGTLPNKFKKRKAQSQTWRRCCCFPRLPAFPHGALLAMGSGSKPNRDTGVLLGLDALGNVNSVPTPILPSRLLAAINRTLVINFILLKLVNFADCD